MDRPAGNTSGRSGCFLPPSESERRVADERDDGRGAVERRRPLRRLVERAGHGVRGSSSIRGTAANGGPALPVGLTNRRPSKWSFTLQELCRITNESVLDPRASCASERPRERSATCLDAFHWRRVARESVQGVWGRSPQTWPRTIRDGDGLGALDEHERCVTDQRHAGRSRRLIAEYPLIRRACPRR